MAVFIEYPALMQYSPPMSSSTNPQPVLFLQTQVLQPLSSSFHAKLQIFLKYDQARIYLGLQQTKAIYNPFTAIMNLDRD